MTTAALQAPPFRAASAARLSRRQTALTLLFLGLAVLAVYFPIRTDPGDNILEGVDYIQLHLHRITFAQEALFGPHPHLPGWYPRELLGTPFWSNIQNFPLIPTRLVLLLFDPLQAYAIGVILSAELAALFAFLFARTLGLSRIAAAAAAWTFACSGYFAARVICGHLPLLEAYPALPLLLWLTHRCLLSPPGRRRSIALRVLGITTTLICLAGHPQLPAYAITAAAAYAIWMNFRRPGATRADTLRILATLALAVGVAAFVLWPMALLIVRSSRILPLDPPDNDIAFPYWRLLAFVLPWRDGWPDPILRAHARVLWLHQNFAVFWETVCYVGLLPLGAALFWLGRAVARRAWPQRAWGFITLIGIAGLLLALPPMHDLMQHLPGVLLRSPARLTYFTLFGLSYAFGEFVDWIWAIAPGKVWTAGLITIVLIVQGVDLGQHDRCFVRTFHFTEIDPEQIKQAVGDGRAAIDLKVALSISREVDDVGFFDSIALARPYRALIDLGNLPPGYNSQYLDGTELGPRALSVCAVKVMITPKHIAGRPKRLPGEDPLSMALLGNAAHRVDFFARDSVVVADLADIHRDLRDQDFDLTQHLLIPPGSAAPPDNSPAELLPTHLQYTRNSEDDMTISAIVQQPGYLRIDEAWDPGWHATVDGNPVSLIAGDDVFLTLPLSPGYHHVELQFSTPGVVTGWIISLASLIMFWGVTRNP